MALSLTGSLWTARCSFGHLRSVGPRTLFRLALIMMVVLLVVALLVGPDLRLAGLPVSPARTASLSDLRMVLVTIEQPYNREQSHNRGCITTAVVLRLLSSMVQVAAALANASHRDSY